MMNATETLIDLRGARLDRRSDVSRGSAGQRRARDEGRTGDLGGEQAEGDARGSQPARASGFGIVIV